MRQKTIFSSVAFLALLLMLISPLADLIPQNRSIDTPDLPTQEPSITEAYGNLPILFIQNQGQLDEVVEYYVKASGQTLYLTNENIVFDLIRYDRAEADSTADRQAERLVFSLDFLGANTNPVIEAKDKDTAVINYLIGNDQSKWHTNIPTHREVIYHEIYPGIDLRLYGSGGVLRYDFIVKPGASPEDIALAYNGIDSLTIADGELVVGTAFGDIKQTKPYIYQQIGDEVMEVEGGFSLGSGDTYCFHIAAYDTSSPLIIDPTLVYSTYLGGGSNETGRGIAVDSTGCAYVTGETDSANFPTQSPYQAAYAGSGDSFVTKLSAAGNSLVYSTYLGGSAYDFGWGIAVDSTGCAYVTGGTGSNNFPTQSPYQAARAGGYDAFVAKLSAAGNSLVYSTYLGGSLGDYGWGIAVDSTGCAYVTGESRSDDFPTQNPYQAARAGDIDAFAAKLSAAGNSLSYSTYLGGSGADYGNGIAVDSTGCAYVAGQTPSADFPTQNPYQAANAGDVDAFVAKLSATGNSLSYSTYLGGIWADYGTGITVDSTGCAYVTGYTESTDFPTQNPYQAAHAGVEDAFVTKLSAAGNSLSYSTYLGGSGTDDGWSIAVDSTGCAYVAGQTRSDDFPTQNPYQPAHAGNGDVFVAKLSAAGNSLGYSTYLGGSGIDVGYGIAVGSTGCAYATGWTRSADFPTQNPYQPAHAGGTTDAFVTKLGGGEPDILVDPLTIDFGEIPVGSTSPPYVVGVGNSGTANLNVGTAVLAGANPDAFAIVSDSVSNQTLAPGVHGIIEVAFSPTAVGTTAILSIPSDDPDENPVNVALNGNGVQTSSQVQSATGTGIVTYGVSSGSIVDLNAITVIDLPHAPVTLIFPHGLFLFRITGLTPGETVTVTVTTPQAVPVGIQYWKYQVGRGWFQLLVGDDDGDNILTFQLTDGGPNDADGLANGIIVDPGGPAIATPTGTTGATGASRASPSMPPTTQLPPADIQLRSLSVSPGETQAGQPVTVLASMVNNGASAGSYNVALRINGRVEQQRMVEVSPGAAYPVKFTVTRSQPGTYTVAIDNQKASFTVLGGSTSGSSASGGLIALIAIAVLILATAVVLVMTFRRHA